MILQLEAAIFLIIFSNCSGVRLFWLLPFSFHPRARLSINFATPVNLNEFRGSFEGFDQLPMTKLVQSMIQPVPGRTSASPLSDSFWKAEIHKYLGKLRENLLTWYLAYILHICMPVCPIWFDSGQWSVAKAAHHASNWYTQVVKNPVFTNAGAGGPASHPGPGHHPAPHHGRRLFDFTNPSARGPRGPRDLGDNCSWLVAAVIDSDVFFVVFIGYKPRTEYDGDLVGGDWNHGTLWLSIYWEFHIPNWRTHIFQRGSIPPTRQWFSGLSWEWHAQIAQLYL